MDSYLIQANNVKLSSGDGASELTIVNATRTILGPLINIGNGQTAFRMLIPSDIPALDANKITTGTLPIARGGTGLAALGGALDVLRVNAAGDALEFAPSAAPNLEAVLTAGNSATSDMTLTNFAVTQTKLEVQNNAPNGTALVEIETFSGPGAQGRLLINSDISRIAVNGDSQGEISIVGGDSGTGTARLLLQGDGGNFMDHEVDLQIRDMSSGAPVLRNTIFSNGEMSGAPGSAPDRFATVSQLPVIPATPDLEAVMNAGETADSSIHLVRAGFLEAIFNSTASGIDFNVIANGPLSALFSSLTASANFSVNTGLASGLAEIVAKSLGAAGATTRVGATATGTGAIAELALNAEVCNIQYAGVLNFIPEVGGAVSNQIVGSGQMTGAEGTAPNHFATVSQIPATPTLQEVTTAGATTNQRVVVNGSNSNAFGIASITNTHATGGGLYVSSVGGVPFRVDGNGQILLQVSVFDNSVNIGGTSGKLNVNGPIRAKGATAALEVGDTTSAAYWSMTNTSRLLSIVESGSTFAGINVQATSVNMLMGIGTATSTSYVDINPLDASWAPDQLRLRLPYTPTGAADANGELGQIGWDDDYLYVKTSAGWKRSALTTF